MNLIQIWNRILLWIIGLYLLLNAGFMQLRIPPTAGAGVPVGELVLLLTLISINYTKILPKLFSVVFAYPFLVWWGLGLGSAVMRVPEYGLWALRDASHVIDSLFLLVGFAFAANPEMIEHFFRWLPKILAVEVIYAALYPFADDLLSISPRIVSANGNTIAILFNYVNVSSVVLMAAAYILIFQKEIRVPIIRNQSIFIAALLWGYTAALFQGRTIYVQICAIIMLFALYRRKLVNRTLLIIVLILGAVALFPVLGLHVRGRIGEEVSLDFFIKHFIAIGGSSSEADVGGGIEGAAAGVELRHRWWLLIYQRLTSDIWNLLFGLGYGIPLTDFAGPLGEIVREPHNSYISIVARIGLVGGTAWVWMHCLMISAWHSAYSKCCRIQWQARKNQLLILMVFFVLIWVFAAGEDGLGVPYVLIPYYFFWGIVLRMQFYLKNDILS